MLFVDFLSSKLLLYKHFSGTLKIKTSIYFSFSKLNGSKKKLKISRKVEHEVTRVKKIYLGTDTILTTKRNAIHQVLLYLIRDVSLRALNPASLSISSLCLPGEHAKVLSRVLISWSCSANQAPFPAHLRTWPLPLAFLQQVSPSP